jgi:hypothetical protein
MILLTLLIVPTLVALGFFIFGGKKVTFIEFVIQNVVQVVIMASFLAFTSCQNTADVEVWNGKVASKERVRVSCRHSYSCNCYESCSGSGNNRSCHQVCQTCYEHGYDVDWDLHTTNGEGIGIDTIDRQGVEEPPRWTAVKVGEPTAVTHSFKNYIKGAPDSLFRKQGLLEQYKDQIPAYPERVYDYYHLNRLVTVGASVEEPNKWNQELEVINGELGASKQVNIVMVVVKGKPEEYFYALEQAWLGGKKNDFIVVANIDENNYVQWAKVMAWTDNKEAEVNTADYMVNRKLPLSLSVLDSIKYIVIEHYKRKPMKDFEYLSHNSKPTMGQWIFAMILGLGISIGMGIMFETNDFN